MPLSSRKKSLFNSANQLIDEALAWTHSLPVGEQFQKCNQAARLQLRCTLDTFEFTEPYLILISQSITLHESIRGKGICRRFFSELEKGQSSVGIVIHQAVQNPHLRSRHYRNGFICFGDDWQFYKRIGPPLKKDHPLYKYFIAEREYIEARKNVSNHRNIGLGCRRKQLVNLSLDQSSS